MALQGVADHGDRHVVAGAADVEGVAAQAADQLDQNRRARALDVEVVVALLAVDDDLLDTDIRDVEAGAEDALVGDHEVVAELGAEHDQRVEAVAAVDPHGRVDGVVDAVRALTAVDVRERSLRVVRVHLDERADEERVVVLLAVQEELREVVVDGERVVAGAAVDRGGARDAVRQVALRRRRGAEEVRRGEAVVGVRAVARRGEDLADLERVVAGVAEDRRRAEVVVEDEGVVAVAAVDLEAAVDEGVVVHALHDAVEDRRAVRPDAEGGDHRGRVRDQLVRAEEEVVRLVGAEDLELVDADDRVVGDVDDRLRLAAGVRQARETDHVRVVVLAAVQVQLGGEAVLERLVAVAVVVDADDVVAEAAVDPRLAAGRADVYDVVGLVADDGLVAAVQRERRVSRRRGDPERVGSVAEVDLELLEAGVVDAECHAEAGEVGRGEHAVVRDRVCAVVGAQLIRRAGAGVERQRPVEDVVEDTAGRDRARGAADAVEVVAGAARDRRRAGDLLDVHRVVARADPHRRRADEGADRGVRVLHVERVAAVAEADRERLEVLVGHRAARAEDAEERRAVEHGRARVVVGLVLDGDDVVAGGAEPVVALDVEDAARDLIGVARRVHIAARPEAGFAADADRVVALAELHCEVAGRCADGHGVVAVTCVDRGRAGVRRQDGDVVVARAERQADGGEPRVDEVAGRAAGAGDGDPIHGRALLHVVGRREVGLLAAAVEDRLVAEREHRAAGGVLRLREGACGRRILNPDDVAARVQDRAGVRDPQRVPGSEAGGAGDRERRAGDGEVAGAEDDAADRHRDLLAGDRRGGERDRLGAADRVIEVALVLRLRREAGGVRHGHRRADGKAGGARDLEDSTGDREVGGQERDATDGDRYRVTGDRRRGERELLAVRHQLEDEGVGLGRRERAAGVQHDDVVRVAGRQAARVDDRLADERRLVAEVELSVVRAVDGRCRDHELDDHRVARRVSEVVELHDVVHEVDRELAGRQVVDVRPVVDGDRDLICAREDVVRERHHAQHGRGADAGGERLRRRGERLRVDRDERAGGLH